MHHPHSSRMRSVALVALLISPVILFAASIPDNVEDLPLEFEEEPDPAPLYGMTQSEFAACVRLGATIQGSAKGSSEQLTALDQFKLACDPNRQLTFAISHRVPKTGPGGIPVSPADWAALAQ